MEVYALPACARVESAVPKIRTEATVLVAQASPFNHKQAPTSSMSRFLSNKNEVPPSGFRYFQNETEFLVTAPSWKELLVNVKKHRAANVLPVGAAFEHEIETWLCSQIPDNWCTSADPDRGPEVPRDAWPIWVKTMALKAAPEDKGVGDTIARIVGPIGGDAFKRFYNEVFGRSCGCVERQEAFNIQYPYKPS